MIDTGTATSGISVVRSLAEKQEHHDADEDDGDGERAHHFDDGRGDEDRGIEEHRIGEIGREARRQRIHGVA